MSAAAARLRITLRRADGRVEARIARPPRAPLMALLRGKTPAAAARLLPLVYPICAAAQEASARSALGMAEPCELSERLRTEILRDHVDSLCRLWPEALGLRPDPSALLAVGHDGRALRMCLFGADPDPPATLSELGDWAGRGATAPARVVHRVLTDWDPGWGSTGLPLFDSAATVNWASATQNGRVVENGPGARLGAASFLDDIAARQGRGTLWRVAACLVEADRLLSSLLLPPAANGSAPCSRGTLMGRALISENRIVRFDRLTPLDFALAPGGAMSAAVEGLPAMPDAAFADAARLVVATLSPCIPHEVEIETP